MRVSRRRFIAGASSASLVVGLIPAKARLLRGSFPTYEGLVASRSRVLYTKDTTNKYIMARSAHIAAQDLTAIKLAFSNFYLPNGGGADTGLGASATVTAAIEYNGAFQQVTFSGSTSGTIADVNLLFSDYAAVSIPASATFWVRTFWHNANGTFYNSWQNSFLGEATALSSTVISDQTMGGTITNSGNFSHPPIAVLGTTRNASVVIIGDSIGNGSPFGADSEDNSNSATGFNGKVGVVARSLGSIPFINLCEGGETAQACVANSPARKQLWQKASHAITQYSVNDLDGGRTALQIIADTQGIWSNLAAFQKIFQTTTTPLASSTDSFATLANQTPLHATERVNFNTAVRAGIAGATGFFDVASALESSFNSGKWVVSPSPPYTGEGIHPTPAGYLLVPAAGVISGISWT